MIAAIFQVRIMIIQRKRNKTRRLWSHVEEMERPVRVRSEDSCCGRRQVRKERRRCEDNYRMEEVISPHPLLDRMKNRNPQVKILVGGLLDFVMTELSSGDKE